MDESELQQIRAARMRELKNAGPAGSEPGVSAAQQQQQQQDKNADMIASVLAQLLDQPARERLNRVRIVKPERAAQVEQILVRMAQTGQISQRVDEPMLKNLLDRLAQQDQSSTQKIIINRRNHSESEDENDEFSRANDNRNEKPADDSDSDFFD